MKINELNLPELLELEANIKKAIIEHTQGKPITPTQPSWNTRIGDVVGVTTDPTDPALGRGVDTKPVSQNEKYLVLSPEERAKGFVRPFRDAYKHVGRRPKYLTRALTDDEQQRYNVERQDNYVLFEEYPESESPKIGRFWTQNDLDSGCQTVTAMNRAIAETYARDPKFYGSTYCIACRMHLPVDEFVWVRTDERVGS